MFFFCSNRFSKRRGIFDTFDTPEKLGAERVDGRKHLIPTPKLHGCAVALPCRLGERTVSRRTTVTDAHCQFLFLFLTPRPHVDRRCGPSDSSSRDLPSPN